MSYNRPTANELGDVSGRYALLVGRWNAEVVENLKAGAVRALRQYGIGGQQVDIFYVPGAFEMPLAAKHAAISNKYVGVICVGAVIRGGTPHFEYVAGECSRGLSQVALDHQIPVGFGVLTVDNLDQAIERSGDNDANKGVEAAMAVMEMVALARKIT
jgi:6,7-dimethyl-8-ribityllumazine synthase